MQCTAESCTGFSLGVLAFPGADEILEQEGIPLDVFLGLQNSGFTYAVGASVDTDSGATRVAAVGPNGEAGAQVKGVTLVETDLVSATIGYGRGKTSGNGQVDINGVVLGGQGVGNGFAIKIPGGNTLLLGIAVAVDPKTLVPGT